MPNERDQPQAIDEAARYFYFLILSSLSDSNFERVSGLYGTLFGATGVQSESATGQALRRFMRLALRHFVRNGWVEIVEDKYSDDYLQLKKNSFALARADASFNSLYEKYTKLGPAGADWLKTAVVRIGRSSSVAQLDKHLRQDSATQGTEDAPSTSDGVSEAQQERALAEEQPWTPLKIDRDSEDFKEAVTASEAALREIEGSNGYATTEPEERNGIISVLRGTIDAIKKGSPSRAAVVHGLLWPLKFIAKKFAETTMGEISKVAAAKVMEWLSSLDSGIF